MARQPKTSKRKYEMDKTTIKCASCGLDSNDTSIAYIKGIARWICGLCKSRMKSKNGR